MPSLNPPGMVHEVAQPGHTMALLRMDRYFVLLMLLRSSMMSLIKDCWRSSRVVDGSPNEVEVKHWKRDESLFALRLIHGFSFLLSFRISENKKKQRRTIRLQDSFISVGLLLLRVYHFMSSVDVWK